MFVRQEPHKHSSLTELHIHYKMNRFHVNNQHILSDENKPEFCVKVKQRGLIRLRGQRRLMRPSGKSKGLTLTYTDPWRVLD